MSSPPLTHQNQSARHRRRSEVAPSDRGSTLVGSDNDTRGFTSGDDDDLDFQSETVFDSFRTGTTNGLRVQSPSLEKMFEHSVSDGGNRHNITAFQDMVANNSVREVNAVPEEDEEMSTPVKSSRETGNASVSTPVRSAALDHSLENTFDSSPPSYSLASTDFGRLSLEDEEEEDWTKDDENVETNNYLSPPLASRRVSPSLRAALGNITNGGSADHELEFIDGRPRSNLFDWSERTLPDKNVVAGEQVRPKTVHGKRGGDPRNSRTVGRRGPSPMHVRSQSVPVVPDVAGQRDHTKLAPKFGTWGLGAKGVSEDWDNDFEFDGMDVDTQEHGPHKDPLVMVVPPAIQASQASINGHVNQIREVCLLVEDLKRLRCLAREQGIIHGPSAALWKEAEGIIALAVPDDEDFTLSSPRSPTPTTFDEEDNDERYQDWGFDGKDLDTPGPNVDVLHQGGRSSAFVYDGRTVRRRSVFSPEDDIFGAGPSLEDTLESDRTRQSSVPRRVDGKGSVARAKLVMENMHQHRSISDPALAEQAPGKMPFDTTSLRDLVNHASALSRALSEIVRNFEGLSPSPGRTPQRESSPAFTRVFTDPSTSPTRHLPRSQSTNSTIGAPLDASPTRSLGQRMHMMTVV